MRASNQLPGKARDMAKNMLPFHESVCMTATTCDLLPSPKRLLTAIKRTVLCFPPKDPEGGKWRPGSLITSAAVRISCVSDRILMRDDRSYSLMAGSYRSSHQQQWLWLLLLLLPAISGSIIAALMNILAHEPKTEEKKADPRDNLVARNKDPTTAWMQS